MYYCLGTKVFNSIPVENSTGFSSVVSSTSIVTNLLTEVKQRWIGN